MLMRPTKNPIDVQIARKIQRSRLQAGMSEQDLATAVGVPLATLRGFEAGRHIEVGILYAIAEVLSERLGSLYEGVWVFPNFGE